MPGCSPLPTPSLPCPPSPAQMAPPLGNYPQCFGPIPSSAGQACFRSCWEGAGAFCGSHFCCCYPHQPSYHLGGKAVFMHQGEVGSTTLVPLLVSGLVVSVCPSITGAFTSGPSVAFANCEPGTGQGAPYGTKSSGRAVWHLGQPTGRAAVGLPSPSSLQGCIIMPSSQGPQKWVCLPPTLHLPGNSCPPTGQPSPSH